MGVVIVEGMGQFSGLNVGHPTVTNGILCVGGGDAALPELLRDFLFVLSSLRQTTLAFRRDEEGWIMALRGPRPKYFVGPPLHMSYSMKPKDPLIHLKSIVSESFYFRRETRN